MLPSLSRALDTPLGSVGSLLPAGVCYRALRRSPRQDFHLLEHRVFQDAPRSHYAWAGATYQRYAVSDGDRRPDLLFYSFAYAYRPESWRKDNGWDWRIFGECAGERTGLLQRAGTAVAGSRSNQVFVGPTTLGVYKNYAVSAGVQFAVRQDGGLLDLRERVRLAVNFTIFF